MKQIKPFREWKKERKRILKVRGIKISGITKKEWQIRYKRAKSNTDQKRTFETCKKISKTNKGQPHPWQIGEKNVSKRPEVRKKISKKLKGRDCYWLKGRKQSPEIIEKRRKGLLKFWVTPEGKRVAKKTGKKISKTNKGRDCYWMKDKTYEEIYGKKESRRIKKQISESHLGMKQSSESIEKARKANTGKKRTPEQCKNLSDSLIGKMFTAKHLKNVRNANKDPKRCNKISKGIIENYKKGVYSLIPNYSELFLMDILNQIYSNQWRYTGDGKLWIGNQNPDFMHKKHKKVIELFGEYWHEKKEQRQRINKFKKEGYDCLVIWQIKHKLWGKPENVANKIISWHES